MSSFEQREDAFEKQFAHDAELRFKAEARRDKLLGLWAAEKLGKTGADAEAYAKAVVVADLAEPGDEDVYRKIKADFEAAGIDDSEHRIRRKMQEMLAKAIAEIKAS